MGFSRSTDGGATWSASATISAISSPGCQAPIIAAHDGSFALITSPIGPGRNRLGVFRASATEGFIDWQAAPAGSGERGVLLDGPAGYSSLLRLTWRESSSCCLRAATG